MVTKTIMAGRNVRTALDVDESGLDDVVVVAYGTQKKTSLTGAIASVKSEDISLRPTSSVASALEGKACRSTPHTVRRVRIPASASVVSAP